MAALLLISVLASCSKKDNGDDTVEETPVYYDFDMTEYINVPKLSDVVIPMSLIDGEWEYACLKIRLDSTVFADVEDADACVQLYDQVVIDYSLTDESAEGLTQDQVKMLTEQDFELVIGSRNFVSAYENKEDPSKNTADFESQLIGAKAGDTVRVTVTFADSFTYTDDKGDTYGSLAGVCVSFDVTVKTIRRGAVPELDNSLVTRYTSSQYITVDAYKEYIYGYFKSTYAYQYFYDATSLKDSYPEKELTNARVTYITNVIDSQYADAGLDDDDIRTLYDSLYNEADKYARKAVYERMVLEYLFSECGITLDDEGYFIMLKEDYDAAYYSYYMYYGVTTMSEYEDYFGKENLLLQYKYQKLLKVIASKVTFS